MYSRHSKLLYIITGVGRPSGTGTSEGPQPMGSFWFGAPWTIGTTGHCPPCPPACYAPVHNYIHVTFNSVILYVERYTKM